jgi:hypothetical protein
VTGVGGGAVPGHGLIELATLFQHQAEVVGGISVTGFGGGP